jgi:hypothetical protein
MNWKEQPVNIGEPRTAKEYFTEQELAFISAQLEKLIDEIPDISDNFGPDGNSYVTLEYFKQQLRDKWLNN